MDRLQGRNCSSIVRLPIKSNFYCACTRIVYERSFLMNLKNSPIARTPPKNLCNFPNELLNSSSGKASSPTSTPHIALAPPVQPNGKVEPTIDEGTEQFEMDM